MHIHREGMNKKNMATVAYDRQELVLLILMASMQTDFLALPKSVLEIIPPKPLGNSRTAESFKSKTGAILAPIAIAKSVVQATARAILHSQHANRLLAQKALGKSRFGLNEVLDILFLDVFKSDGVSYAASLNRMRDQVLLEQSMYLSKDENTNAETRAICLAKLFSLRVTLKANQDASIAKKASVLLVLKNLDWYERDPEK